MEKWLAIATAAFFVAMFGSMAYTEHTKAECRMELAKAGRTAVDIQSICR